jgi:hypothetical protein
MIVIKAPELTNNKSGKRIRVYISLLGVEDIREGLAGKEDKMRIVVGKPSHV